MTLRPLTSKIGLLLAIFSLFAGVLGNAAAAADAIKLEARLIWASPNADSNNPKHKPVDAKLAKKLDELRFQYKHYFEDEADRKVFSVKMGTPVMVTISKDCQIEVEYSGTNIVKVTTFGKKEKVNVVKQGLPPGETMIMGGSIERYSAWFVVLKQVTP